MTNRMQVKDLKKLFTKSYGEKPPSRDEWSIYYCKDVLFIDPTQEKVGLDSYIEAQDRLIKRCKDVYLETHSISITQNVGFVEWTMGLKILNKEFIYPGVTKLIFDKTGKITEHRDYFDFCGPTFAPVPILGPFIKWLYSKFAS